MLTHDPSEPAACTTDTQLAILTAARSDHDLGGWIAAVLCTAAAQLGSTDALTARDPNHGKPPSSNNSSKAPSATTTTTSRTTRDPPIDPLRALGYRWTCAVDRRRQAQGLPSQKPSVLS